MPAITAEINSIRAKVATMCEYSINMFRMALQALRGQDHNLAREIIGRDSEVDALETEIEDMCLRFLAKYAPKAFELRYAVAITRLVTDVERIADHSTVIGREILSRHLAPVWAAHPKLGQMTELASSMVTRAVDALFAVDDIAYQKISADDRVVGDLQRSIESELVGNLARDPDSAPELVSALSLIRRVERVGDHAKNIAIMIPYITRGELLRHRPESNINDDTND
ncbi:MAG: phosphate signaling complex protein PhoU [Deltaproteobacteria bacterium]|nr:phosphate signaling complex protein PhoU [Deltaproteobacteria bacterium]